MSLEDKRSGVAIRPGAPADLDAVLALETDAFSGDRLSRRSLRRFLAAPARPVLVATLGGEIAGYALIALRENARNARIYSIAVGARFARRGVGRALMQACERHALAARKSGLTLEVRYDNAPAIALYESLGYRQLGEHADYYDDGATALRYVKRLCEPAGSARPGDESALRRAPRPRKLAAASR